jgi:hypothetical protein
MGISMVSSRPAVVDPNLQASKSKKPKNFVAEKECQFCVNFLHISQNPKTRNGKKSNTFWDRVCEDYNKNKLICGIERLTRSLETKWGIIKYDVAKFCGCYNFIIALNDSRSFQEDTLQKALELCKLKHLKHQSFTSLVSSKCSKTYLGG